MDDALRGWFRAKHLVSGFIAVMAAYVLYHNERFLIDWTHPVWQHYESFKWWLLPHGLTGACALILAPPQFSDRLRQRFTKLHRITGPAFSIAFVTATAIFGGFTPLVATFLVEVTGNRAAPALWLSLAAAISLTAALVLPFVQSVSQGRARPGTVAG
jgi:hypothetical protein